MEELSLDCPDGPMLVRRFRPKGTPHGGVLFYMDAFGWRDELDAMAARYAAAGYVTYLPNLYWRLGTVRFPVPARAEIPLDPAMTQANLSTTMAMSVADAPAMLADAASLGVDRLGAVGYCMGARHALGVGAAYGERIRAVACLHGGRLVWDGEDSPHLTIPRLRGGLYLGFAENDDTCPPIHQALLERMFRESGRAGEVEYYSAKHGWTFPSRWCHSPQEAERAHAKVLALFRSEVAKHAT